LLFQPIVSLVGRREQRYEVFLRLRDRLGHELLPETVFDVTKKHALGARLDGWVVNESLKLLAARPSSAQPRTLFINLSPATLLSRAIRPWLRERLEKSKTDPRSIVFEMSEDKGRQHLFELRSFLAYFADLGCGLSLERFGCRPDSLNLLEQLDVNYVKLNSRFVKDLRSPASPFAKQNLKALTEALNGKGVTIVMSGIEDFTALPTLWSCGVHSVQGFSVQRPSEVMSYDFS
jgi:EAL domain-containing protein (putative c-di-GMP-specific phosphodiesterase class I)